MTRQRRWGLWLGLAMVGAALLTELRKPREERTWHGRIAGIVPYDFRMPTFQRLQYAWWSPQDDRIFSETPFGVGWTLNIGRLARLIGARRGTPAARGI